MTQGFRVFGLACAFLLAAGIAASAQEKKPPAKGQLPANWGKLSLSDEQRDKVYAIQAEYKDKIDELTKQLNDLRKKQSEALASVLTDGQKARLKEILLEKVPGGTDKKPETKPSDKPPAKPGDKSGK